MSSKIKSKKLEKSTYFRNKVASISNYSYLDIEEQMSSLLRMTSEILEEDISSRKYKKEFYKKHALKRDLLDYIELVKKNIQPTD